MASVVLHSENGPGGNFVHLLCIYCSVCKVGFEIGFT